jgi:hypothetical protein
MPKNRKTKTASPRKLDPTKATVYVAVITLLSAAIVACIANIDKLRASPQSKSQVEEIIAFQEHQYDEVVAALDASVSEAQEEETKLPAPRKAKTTAQLRHYIAQNRETKVTVAAKHAEFKAAMKRGDYFKANIVKTEVNDVLGREQERYLIRHKSVRRQRSRRARPVYFYRDNQVKTVATRGGKLRAQPPDSKPRALGSRVGPIRSSLVG